MPNKYIFKGGLFDKTFSVARAALSHFDKWGILHASPDALVVGTIPLVNVKVLTAAYTVTGNDNGTTFILNSTTGIAVTLPPASRGKMKFALQLLQPSGTGAHKFTPASTDLFQPLAAAAFTAGQTIGFASASDAQGNLLEVVSDGVTTWYVTASSGTVIANPT